MRRVLVLSVLLAVAVLAAAPASARPKPLRSAADVLAALKAGSEVRCVFRYKDMKLFDDAGKEETAPDATGGMSLDAWEYFASGVVGNPVGYVASSQTHLIRHPRYGYVLSYVKVSVYDDGKVKIVAQYLEPATHEVKMDETFTTEVADGKNAARAFFFVAD
jgi:hypothetical protein